ncbi:hypothetical protein [Thermus caldilimi]|nr:hypothetical protein [Thermus caldilimi]
MLWVQSALEAGREEEAKEALALGLKRFPGSSALRQLEGLPAPP